MDVPDDIEYSETRSIYRMSCETPYELQVGCELGIIANIPFELEGRTVRLSSTQDGKTLVVTNNFGKEIGSAIFEGLTYGLIDPSAVDLGHAIRIIINELETKGIKVLDIIVIRELFDAMGYILTTDGDALTELGARPLRE